MQDLSLHILDIAENSTSAGASLIEISVTENTKQNTLILTIKDNGAGLDKEEQIKVLDPFYSTKKTRRIGLGLPLLAQAAKEAEGDLSLTSKKGKGTTITARFTHDHIDRKPLGDIASTLIALIAGSGSDMDFQYKHLKDGNGFQLDTREIKEELQEVPINTTEVLNYLKETIIKKEGKL
ncbi:MAG: ATP-binding protein [bacterium]|nr:ATP-binding protein [bacterium]